MGDITLFATPYGRPAANLLRERISAAKADDPLRPVTIVVPTNYVGVSTRRLLASGQLGAITQRGSGIAGITLLTVYRLAELLGAPVLAGAGRRPVSTPVIAAAVRQVLATDAGLFSAAATHPSTEEGLVRAYRELSELRPEALDRLARRSQRAADVVRIHRRVQEALAADWFGEADLMAAGTAAVQNGSSVVADLGTIVLYLPQNLSLPAAELLTTVAERAHVEVIAGATGEPKADADVERAVRRLGVDLHLPRHIPANPPTAVVSVSDAEEEARTAVEQIIAATRGGVPLERLAVVYPTAEPYARVLHEQLTAAGIAYNGRAVRSLSDRVLGRWLLDLLVLPDRNYSRPAVLSLLSAGPMRGTDGGAVSPSAWERVSREAGIVRGASEWNSKLTVLAEKLRARAAVERRSEEPREWRVEQLERDATRADQLREFVAALFSRVEAAAQLRTWSELAAWATDMVSHYLGDERQRSRWPDVERAAAERVEAALERLAGLDRVEPATDVEVFTRTLQLELDDDLGRVGTFGQGVLVGSMSSALGVDLELVIVLGLAEGVCPSRVREDSLLPDVEREVVREELSPRADRIGTEHRHLLAALAGADQRVLVYPRGDLRRSMVRPPSRWLLDCCEAVTGTRALPAGAGWFSDVPSFAQRMATVDFPATLQEYGLRGLGNVARRNFESHPLVAAHSATARSAELLRLRGGDSFTRFDGNLGDVAGLPAPDDPHTILTATQLEGWLGCPHAYFMQHVLRVKPIENPEELLSLEPMERGTLMHDVLEKWLERRLAEGVPAATEPWSEAAREDMVRLAAQACDDAERRGVTGHPLLWQRERELIMRDLLAFVLADDERRARHGLTPIATERPFGMDGGDPLEVEVRDGTTIRLRGRIDRIDRTADGRLVVTDFKTGKADSYKDLTQDRPLADGTKLQLALYGLAMAPQAGEAGVRSEYWFTSSRGEFKRVGYDLDDNATARLQTALQIIVGGLRRGLFPLKPAEPGWRMFNDCRFCDPDDLGTTDRHREWETLRSAPELRDYVAYVEPEALAEVSA